MNGASGPVHQPRQKVGFLFVRNVVVVLLPLFAVWPLMSGVEAGDRQAAEQVCAQHSMVVRTLDYPRKGAQATGVTCTPAGRWDDQHAYALSESGLPGLLGGFFVPFVCLVYLASGCLTLAAWNVIARLLRARSAR
ncbi:hypothetical protein [Planotetraspora phitsanulokensis]|uniref:Uncharacterized protein n=1 Tax=Planotetraspora phitsanulokensis TaxID=575192 RepID=A0A8J3UFL1_9ACTN|nr:hypothetical protein [Planotetraspora phitsanulokensis]GII42792.1 hypothetical protein Pph01_77950 [Planotetraspora phitsanulokensis]